MRSQDILDHLEKLMVLKALAESGSIRRASQTLNIAQPSLSVKIKNLESIMGIKLISRSRSGVILTSEGQILLDFVNLLMQEAQALPFRLAHKSEVTGIVRVGAYDSIARYFWSQFYKYINKKYPGLQVILTTGRSQSLMQMLIADELDMVLSVSPEPGRGYFTENLYVDHFSFYCSRDYLRSLKDVKKHKGVYLLNKPSTPLELISFSKVIGRMNDIFFRQHEVENFEIALEFCRAGMGLAILPTLVAEADVLRKRIVRVSCPFEAPILFQKHSIGISIRSNAKVKSHMELVYKEIKNSILNLKLS